MYRRFSDAKEKSFKNALDNIVPMVNPQDYVFEATTNVVDTNTLFTVSQIRVNIFQGIAIKPTCREFCNK